MQKIDKKEFRMLSLEERYTLIKKEGEYIGGRLYGSHFIYLYALSGFFVELWVLLSFNKIQWIEIQDSRVILNEYVKDIDVKKDLGI